MKDDTTVFEGFDHRLNIVGSGRPSAAFKISDGGCRYLSAPGEFLL
jgi:hypothetical protein